MKPNWERGRRTLVANLIGVAAVAIAGWAGLAVFLMGVMWVAWFRPYWIDPPEAWR